MMAQNTPDDKEISDSDYDEIKKPSESAELIPVGASNDDLKSYLDERLKPGADDFDRKIQPERQPTKAMYEEFLRYRGQVYEETLRQACTNNATRSDAERNDDERIEDFFVGVIEDDFKKYANGRPDCGRSECWAARERFVKIVVALIGADDRKSLKEGLQQTLLSKGLLALAIAAENNDLTMVDALKDTAVADERFMESSEPDLFSPDMKKSNLFYNNCDELVYALYPYHEIWLCPIEAAARLGYVDMVTKLIELREPKVKAGQEKRKKELSEQVMKKELVAARMKKILSQAMMHEKSKRRRALDWAVWMGHFKVVNLLIDKEYIVDLNEASNVFRLLDYADIKSYGWHQTPLALAVLTGHFEVVEALCDATKGGLRTEAKNGKGKSAIEIAFKKSRYGATANYAFQGHARYKIWEHIMKRHDSRREVKKLTQERKVHVDAINAILVGTALIATATFAGWLIPPLGYSSPPGMDGPFASVEGHPILGKFWVFNSLSFFFSIATFMVGVNVAFPPPQDIYIGDVVESLRWKLRLAYYLVSAAVAFVIGAFASAGFAVLPPIPKYTVNMAVTVGIGVTVVAVVVFSTSFEHVFPTGWQQCKHEMESIDDD